MSNKAIGELTCPLCRSKKAKVSVSKSGLCVATCNRCHMQLFTRSDLSDAAMRGQIRPFEETALVESSSVAIQAAPAPAPVTLNEPEERPAWLQW